MVEEEAIFQDRINQYGKLFNPPFKIIDVPGDGNCFYHAIRETMNRSTENRLYESHNHQSLRKMVVEHIYSNHTKFEEMFETLYHSEIRDREAVVTKYLTVSFDFYIHDQAQMGTYADEIAIQSMAGLLKMDIIVISSVNGKGDQFMTVFNSLQNRIGKRSIIIVCKPNRHFYATEMIQWENGAEEEITKQQINRFGSLFQPPFQVCEAGEAVNLYETILKTAEIFRTKDHVNFEFINSFKLKNLTSARLKTFILAAISKNSESYEVEAEAMRELFQGEPPIQYKEGVEEYIRHHSGERAIADELILKTISRVFNLNFMIISVQGSTCTETIIAEHRRILTTENTLIIVHVLPNKFLATSRVDNAKLETRMDKLESRADLQPQPHADQPAHNVADIPWEDLSSSREAGFAKLHQSKTYQTPALYFCSSVKSRTADSTSLTRTAPVRFYNQDPIEEDLWPQEVPLPLKETGRESIHGNNPSTHLDGIEQNRKYIRECSGRVHKLYNGKLNTRASVAMEVTEESSIRIEVEEVKKNAISAMDISESKSTRVTEDISQDSAMDISDSISTRMDNQTFAHGEMEISDTISERINNIQSKPTNQEETTNQHQNSSHAISNMEISENLSTQTEENRNSIDNEKLVFQQPVLFPPKQTPPAAGDNSSNKDMDTMENNGSAEIERTELSRSDTMVAVISTNVKHATKITILKIEKNVIRTLTANVVDSGRTSDVDDIMLTVELFALILTTIPKSKNPRKLIIVGLSKTTVSSESIQITIQTLRAYCHLQAIQYASFGWLEKVLDNITVSQMTQHQELPIGWTIKPKDGIWCNNTSAITVLPFMRDCHNSALKLKKTAIVELYILAKKQEYKYCCKISETEHIQHNGQGEVDAEESEEQTTKTAEGTAICEALAWVRILQESQKITIPRKLIVFMVNDGWLNEIQNPKIVENNLLVAIKHSINALNISEVEYSELISSSGLGQFLHNYHVNFYYWNRWMGNREFPISIQNTKETQVKSREQKLESIYTMGNINFQTALLIQPTESENDIGNNIHATIIVLGNKDTFKYCIRFGKYSYVAEGTVSVNHKSNECILSKDNTIKLTEAVAEIQAVVEAFGWLRLIKDKFNFNIPQNMTLFMKREFIISSILQEKSFKGPLCRDKQLLKGLFNSLEITNLSYQKYDNQSAQSNTRTGLRKNWVQLVNGSYSMPDFNYNLLPYRTKDGINEKREIHEVIATSNTDGTSQPQVKPLNKPAFIAKSNTQNTEQAQFKPLNKPVFKGTNLASYRKTPIEEIPWREFGILLNVDNSKAQIPSSLINKVRIVFQKVLRRVEESIHSPSITLWLKRLEIIPISLFTIKAIASDRHKEMKRRLELMMADKWQEITFELVYKSRYIGQRDTNYKQKRSEELLKQGLVSKSFRQLQAPDIAKKLEVNDETINKLKQLNPKRPTPFQNIWLHESVDNTSIPDIQIVQVEKAINKLDPEVNPGLMKFRNEHLQDLIGRKGGQRQGQEFLKEYTKFINLIAKGNVLPMDYHQFLGSCQSMPLPKGDSNIRPIAMPHLARKVVEKCLASLYSKKFENHFHGLQYGVATPGGTEKVIHSILDHQRTDPTQDIVLLDSENAFNNLNRDCMFEEVKNFFPELLPYVLSIYNQPTQLFIHQDNGTVTTIQSTMGSHQGAPLGSMLYSAGQQPLLRKVCKDMRNSNGGTIRALIDDMSLQGHSNVLIPAIQFLIEEGKSCGIKFKYEKIKIFIGDCDAQTASARINQYQQLFNGRIPPTNFSIPEDAPHNRGIQILSVPIGSEEYTQKIFQEKMEEIEADIRIIKTLNNVHQQWTYTYYVLSGKLNYLYRATRNVKLTLQMAYAFEKIRKALMETMIDNKLTDFQQFQMYLGISSGGFGLQSQVHMCQAANLAASIEYVRHKLQMMPTTQENPRLWLSQLSTNTDSHLHYTKDIINDARIFRQQYGDPMVKPSPLQWEKKIEMEIAGEKEESEEIWLTRLLFKDSHPLQNSIYHRIFNPTAKAYVEKFLQSDTEEKVDKARFRSAAFEHSGKWLATIPREGFWMSSREFRIALQLRFGINKDSDILTCACGKGSAQDHQHLLNCHLGNQVINRHTAVVNYFCDIIKSANHQVVREEQLVENPTADNTGLRSDFTIKRANVITGSQRHQHYDVTIVNPSAKSYVNEVKSHEVTGAAAQRAHQLKIRKYTSTINSQDFHPLVFETYGFWNSEVTDLIQACCVRIEETTGTPYSSLINYWISRLSFTLQWENAIAIMERHDYSELQEQKKSNSVLRWKDYRREELRIK